MGSRSRPLLEECEELSALADKVRSTQHNTAHQPNKAQVGHVAPRADVQRGADPLRRRGQGPNQSLFLSRGPDAAHVAVCPCVCVRGENVRFRGTLHERFANTEVRDLVPWNQSPGAFADLLHFRGTLRAHSLPMHSPQIVRAQPKQPMLAGAPGLRSPI
jgi:hypothetical protein